MSTEPMIIRNKDTGDIWRISNRREWPYSGFELEVKITEYLRTRNWEIVTPSKFGQLE